MTTIYFDTSGWNALLDWHLPKRRSLKPFDGHDILFSSYDLDEFAIAKPPRDRQLAQLAWRIRNRKKLKDHVEIMIDEIVGLLANQSADYFDDDAGFMLCWNAMRKGEVPSERRGLMGAGMEARKRSFREQMLMLRQILKSGFEALKDSGFENSWAQTLKRMELEKWFQEFLWNNLSMYAEFTKKVSRELLFSLDYRELRCTTVGLQYLFALHYTQTHHAGKFWKPDYGDQVDAGHVFYAGLSDYYVTADDRMYELLTKFLTASTGQIVNLQDLLAVL